MISAAPSSINTQSNLGRATFVCALGYFIDVFDIQLFAVLRVPSLTSLGVAPDALASVGGYILNVQMLGMLIGAFLWGWLGDRFGRLKALYGSILIYSLGTLACSLVHNPETYGIARFITGFGLAGETGAAITLIAEMMPVATRTWGIITVAGIGFLGPVFAVLISWFALWRETYIVAGIMGLVILVLRIKLSEPLLFKKITDGKTARGSLRLLMHPRQIMILFYALMIGMPLAYGWNLLNFFSAEFSQAILKPGEKFNQKLCLLAFYIGTSCGDVLSGALSQFWQSRRKSYAFMLLLGVIVSIGYLLLGPSIHLSANAFYAIYFLLGIAGGCWVLQTTIYAEQFGTNLRATAAIVLTNAVRGFSIPIIFAFHGLCQTLSITNAAASIGIVIYIMGFIGIYQLRETHNLDLDYVETR